MSQSRRAIYFPKLTLVESETRFGSKKLLQPANPYVLPLTNKKTLVKIDLLVCMQDIWGSSILTSRDNVYKMVSGDTDNENLRGLICTYYRTHSAFANYVDMLFLLGDRRLSFIERFGSSVREKLNTYGAHVAEVVDRVNGTKFLLEDHEYRWYAVESACLQDLKELEGVELIV